MAVSYWLDRNAAGGGDGSQNAPWNSLASLRAVSANDVTAYLTGDFTDDTAGTNGYIEVGGNNWTLVLDANCRIGSPVSSTFSITSIVMSAGTATVTTSAAHGFVANDTVNIAGVTGAASASNGNRRVVTAPTSTTFTFALTGTGTSSNGTAQRLSSSKYGIYCSAKTGLSVGGGGEITQVERGVFLTGACGTGPVVADLTITYCGKYAVSSNGTTAGLVVSGCSISLVREDAINISGGPNTDFVVRDCEIGYCGYDFDGTTKSDMSGAGDGVTTHTTSNYGIVEDCIMYWCAGNACAFTNSAGTSIVRRNFCYECSDSAIVQNGGGSMDVYANLVIAPVNAVLGSSSPRSCIRFNPAASTGGTFRAYGNTCYTARGTQADTTNSCYGLSAANYAASSSCEFYGNRIISNGTAPFVHLASTGTVTLTNVALSGGTCTVTTSGAHSRATGDRVLIYGVTGAASAANGIRTITVTGASTFTFALAGTGTSTNGSAQRCPQIACDGNAYSGASSATLFTFAGSKTGVTWQGTGLDAAAVFSCSIATTPPTTAQHFRVLSTSGAIDAVGPWPSGPAGAAYDYMNASRGAGLWTAGAYELSGNTALWGGGTGFTFWGD